ncbi:hypothetical protein MZO42_02540 [Sphingomonas psychrotolerans]|uniref:Uncharacterized protein n=1 Tax=Sphingomonas psychrotolerans TaxID=1327635 RepID=A0ABU3N2W8_9SPHN|nr:hypothetical protein [Sphingomonas psychrotolerans]MDT8757565.1 hypothetical protein [Sphingomonas psychrotolerans]
MTEPNRAPLNDTPEPREEATAAYQLTADEPLQDGAAGGGMGGRSAADSAPNAVRPEQAATPSNPDSPAIAGDAASLRAEKEAQHLSVAGEAPEPKPLPNQ